LGNKTRSGKSNPYDWEYSVIPLNIQHLICIRIISDMQKMQTRNKMIIVLCVVDPCIEGSGWLVGFIIRTGKSQFPGSDDDKVSIKLQKRR
jgi:hypothetical protein